MANVNLITPSSILDSFNKLADGRQRKPKIDRDELNLILIDYSVMLNALRSSSSFKVSSPEPVQARRQRLALRP